MDNAEYQRKWRAENKDKVRIYNKRWREKHPIEASETRKSWVSRNIEKQRLLEKDWRDKNADYIKQFRFAKYHSDIEFRTKQIKWLADRKALKIKSKPKWANEFFIEEIYDLSVRRSKLKSGGIDNWHVDHIVPLKSDLVCGLHVHNNLAVIPASINLSKNNRYWPDMP